jgi:hypothetical protein
MFKDTLCLAQSHCMSFRRCPPVKVLLPSRECYFHQLDACLVFSIKQLILSSCNNYLRRIHLCMEAISFILDIIFNFEQVLDCEFFWLQVPNSEKLNSIFCSENVAVHDSLYWNYSIIADLKYILLILLIPYFQAIFIGSYQRDWFRYMTQGWDLLPP